MKRPSPVVLAIVGGLGLSPVIEGNAVAQARMPWFLHAVETYPAMSLLASGSAVGLSRNAGGSPEAGYRTIGLGRPWLPSEARVDAAISSGTIATNATLRRIAAHLKQTGGRLHLIGLLSAGDTCSKREHVDALLELVRDQQLSCVLHVFLDAVRGSDQALVRVQQRLEQEGIGSIGSIMGSLFGMDDDGHWDRTERAYRAIVMGDAPVFNRIEDGFAEADAQGHSRDAIEPFLLQSRESSAGVTDRDAILFWNSRPGGMRQLLSACALPEFRLFNREKTVRSRIATLVPYERDLPVDVCFPPERTEVCLGSVLSEAGLRQLRVGETERYAHVTVFLNGMVEDPFPGEHRAILSSPAVSSYDVSPDMQMPAIAERVVQELASNTQDMIVCSLVAPDIVARTGNMAATVAACEAANHALARIAEAVLAVGGTLLITSDHGRAESMIDPATESVRVEGSDRPVPFLIIRQAYEGLKASAGDAVAGDLTASKPARSSGRPEGEVLTLRRSSSGQ